MEEETQLENEEIKLASIEDAPVMRRSQIQFAMKRVPKRKGKTKPDTKRKVRKITDFFSSIP